MRTYDTTTLSRSVEFKESADGTRVRVAAIDVLIETAFFEPPFWARQVTAKFDIPGVAKEDMNVTYHPFPARLEISWRSVNVMEGDVEECMTVREERSVCRTILLPEGTRVSSLSSFYTSFLSQRGTFPLQFDEIDAKLHRRLEVTYPKVRASRTKPRTPTPQRRRAQRYGGSESRTLDAW